MANRPPFLCELDKDKLIDTQVGFVDTFNWAVQAIDNLEGGKNCTIDWSLPDHPVINVDIPKSGGSGGGSGGEGGRVDDVTVVSHDISSLNDKIKVDYVDGTSKTEDIPFEPAIDNISRQWMSGQDRQHEYLSCTYNRGSNTLLVPYDFRISSIGSNGITYSDTSRVCISSMNDTNIKVNHYPTTDGIILQIGVYYV